MAIKNIQVNNIGQAGVAPSLVYIETTSTRAQVAATGFLNGAAQKWGVDFNDEQLAIVSTKATPNAAASRVDAYRLSGSGQVWSLVPVTNDPSHVVKYAGKEADGGGSATVAIAVTGVLATDVVFAQVEASTNAASVQKVTPTADTVTVILSADPGADTILSYQVLRAYS